MPRYFFDVHNGVEARDTIGVELRDPEAARLRAGQIAGAYAAGSASLDADGGAIVVRVRDDADREAITLRLAFNVEAAQHAGSPRS